MADKDMKPDQVAIYQITQATTATFADLYLRQAFLFFIESGSKRVVTPTQDLTGNEGDLLVFPAGSIVTMENRPVLDRNYRALGIAFPDASIARVFDRHPAAKGNDRVHVLKADPFQPLDLVPIIRETFDHPSLPATLRAHRLLEPLIWIREHGVRLAPGQEETTMGRVRRLIEQDLGHPWRAAEAARQLAMSEATLRRWLGATGQRFSKILINTRLEHGLSLLQTTDRPITTIALDCGFKTPSHFSEAFRKRFAISPRQIRVSTAEQAFPDSL